MGDLHGRLPRRGLSIERQQPVLPKRFEHIVDDARFDIECVEIAPGDATSGVLRSLTEGDQSQEHLSHRSLPRPIGLTVEAFRARG